MVNYHEIEIIAQESVRDIKRELELLKGRLDEISNRMGPIGELKEISRDIGHISRNMPTIPIGSFNNIDQIHSHVLEIETQVKEIKKYAINLGYLERIDTSSREIESVIKSVIKNNIYDRNDLKSIKFLLSVLIILFTLFSLAALVKI